MARTIVVLCDVCNDAGERIEATSTETITLGSAKPRLVDFCDDCKLKHYDSFAEMVKRLGVPLDKVSNDVPNTSSKPYSCPVPGCSSQGFSKNSAKTSHVRKTHPDVADQYLQSTEEPIPCDIPGCDGSGKGGRGIVQHVRGAHPDKFSAWYKKYKARQSGAPQLDVVSS